MRELDDLQRLIDAGTALVMIDSADPGRIEQLQQRLLLRSPRSVYRWSLASGLRGSVEGDSELMQPQQLLGHILHLRQPGVFFLLDLNGYLQEPAVISLLREIALQYSQQPHTLIIIGRDIAIPIELRPFSAKMSLSLPSADELRLLIDEEATLWGQRQQKRVQAQREAVDALIRNLTGLTHGDARRLIRTAIADDGLLDERDVETLRKEKYRLLDRGGVLSFELDAVKLDDVAGLARLKTWLGQRRDVFLGHVSGAGLDPPKGVLLLGVQGGGKSLAAKSIAGAWNVPLLRLDFATLYNKYYGETERNLREALDTATAMAPCVLWIDEIEKGLASEGDDGGPGKRILGSLLTWMAERKARTFLVATANDISALPPELLRKGRFDEIFFVDLPSPAVRETIFQIHLRKRSQAVDSFDLKTLAVATEGFAGAEIEQVIVSSLYAAKAENTALNTEHLLTQAKQTRPLSVLMAEKIAALRAWAAERTVMAD